IFVMFNSLIAKITWDRFIIAEKKVFLQISIPLILVFLVFTHLTHIWADATGYVEVTRFTTRLPLFYPSTSKRFMVRHGLADISQRRNLPEKFGTSGSDFYYPQKPLEYDPDIQHNNILIIAIDAMRYDMLNSQNFNRCYNYARNHGTIFTNHYSGGNSTKMGSFTLFYGIPPTYQQYIESNKKSPVLIDRILETGYNTGIFTSYKLYAPANLDVTAFVKIPDLRLETTIPGPQSACRNDSAITDQWKSWVHQNSGNKPFFGFLFYDALCTKSYPESYKEKIDNSTDLSGPQKKFMEYKISLQYTDSLVASVLYDLSESDLLKNTVVIITSDHGEEFDDNGLGYNGHGSSFSDWQIKTPLITVWPEMEPGIVDNRTSHYDIAATLMKDVFGVLNPESDFCSGKNLFSDQSWDWLLIGSYFNFAILEPQQITVQFPGGYYEVRGKDYRIIQKPQFSPNITAALNEMGRFFNKN
ncbi:MAG TPA: sulfatase-like hydrolase/transferase, partial [Chitinispirillaceae bacterium]|nr:sulfatase-like hydrolase/transferase [Chitinispirillaceae bacterium]